MTTPSRTRTPSRAAAARQMARARQLADRRPAEPGRGGLRRLSGLTVQGWFALVFAALTLLAVAAAVTVAQLVAEGRQIAAELDQSLLPAQAQAYRLQAALLDQEIGARGFALTGRRDLLQPYPAGLAAESAAVARLRALIGDDRQLRADLARVEQAENAWRRASVLPLIALARRGPLTGNATGLLLRSQTSFGQARTLLATLNAHLSAAATGESARQRHVRTLSNWIFGLVLAGFLLAATLLTLVLRRAVVRPLNRLRDASKRVISGDISHRIEVTGPADLRAVAADVEAMRGALVETLRETDAQAAELLRSNAELEQFAYVASHDLQEPLRKVASFCQLLERRYGDQLDERGRQYIDFAVDGAKRLQILINDLLTFSRVGRADEVRVRLPLDQPLDAAINALGAAIEESGAVIERPERLPEVMGDATLLTILWQNLIGNGIKFRAPQRPPVLRVTAAEQPGGMWRLCVEDNGIGIPPEFAEKIFVIFQRLHSREAYPGTGIGLALGKRIVEHHGGEIALDPARTEGTRICFTLPVIDPAGRDQAGPDDPDQADQADQSPGAQPPETSSTSAASTEGTPA